MSARLKKKSQDPPDIHQKSVLELSEHKILADYARNNGMLLLVHTKQDQNGFVSECDYVPAPCFCMNNARVGICERRSDTETTVTCSTSQTQVSSTGVTFNIQSGTMASTSSLRPAGVEYELEPQCYKLTTPIGIGYDGSSTIYAAKHIPSGSMVAVRKTDLEAIRGGFCELQHEFYLMKLIKHESILTYHVAFVCDNELWVIMPLMELGSTRDMLDYSFPDGFGEVVIAHIIRDVLQALDYIHKMGHVHRSIDASHILVSQSGKVCISGLRTSVSMIEDGRILQAIHSFPAQAVKMLPWLAPEVLEQNVLGYDTKSDIYSIGITACELANGCVPFSDMVPMKMLLEKLNGTTPKLLDRTTLSDEKAGTQQPESSTPIDGGSGRLADHHNPYTRLFSLEFHNFVEVCLKRDPYDSYAPGCCALLSVLKTALTKRSQVDFNPGMQWPRPSADKLLQHPFFKQTRRRTSEALAPFMQCLKTITEIMESKSQNHHDGEAGMSSMTGRLEALQINHTWHFE